MAITLHDKISESATTSVYRAYDEALGREVLLKVLHRHLAHDDQVRQRFIREARACAALHSEYIVQVFDLRDHEGSPAIVMEYVDGRSLKDVIAEGKQRTYGFTEKVAAHVLSGLTVAHSHGVIHRDIKPANILVSSSGTIKITDFGLAQVAVAPTLTAEGMIVGTPAYFAPEVIQGHQADSRSDLFSLGATLVETLTGERIFEGVTYSECLNRIALFKTDGLDSLTSSSSPQFVAFLKKLMDPDRSRRFSSPRDALASLKRNTSSQFTLPLPRPAHARRRAILRTAGILLSLLTVAGVVFIMRRSANGPVKQPELPHAPAETSSFQMAPPRDTTGKETADLRVANALPNTRRSLSAAEQRGAPSVQQSGSLALSGNRGAKVQVDEQLVGVLPLESPLKLRTGVHTVVFTLAPFDPIVRAVQINPGQETSVSVDFLESASYFRCIAKPWADIFVDDQYRDTTPIDHPIAVTGGKHRVRFHHPSFRDSVWEVSIAPGDTIKLAVSFMP
jgi:serine/threonine protein kinase